jgi:hypothetical protein
MVLWCFTVEPEMLLQARAFSLLVLCGLVGLTPYLFTFFGAKYAPLGQRMLASSGYRVEG